MSVSNSRGSKLMKQKLRTEGRSRKTHNHGWRELNRPLLGVDKMRQNTYTHAHTHTTVMIKIGTALSIAAITNYRKVDGYKYKISLSQFWRSDV